VKTEQHEVDEAIRQSEVTSTLLGVTVTALIGVPHPVLDGHDPLGQKPQEILHDLRPWICGCERVRHDLLQKKTLDEGEKSSEGELRERLALDLFFFRDVFPGEFIEIKVSRRVYQVLPLGLRQIGAAGGLRNGERAAQSTLNIFSSPLE